MSLRGRQPAPQGAAVTFHERDDILPVLFDGVDQRPVVPGDRESSLMGYGVASDQHQGEGTPAPGQRHGLGEPVGRSALVSDRNPGQDEVHPHPVDDPLPDCLHDGAHLLLRPGV